MRTVAATEPVHDVLTSGAGAHPRRETLLGAPVRTAVLRDVPALRWSEQGSLWCWRMGRWVSPLLHRATERALAAGLFFLTAPFALIAMGWIRFEGGGPTVFVQDRVGAGGIAFPCLKFRSMTVDAEARRNALLGTTTSGVLRFKMRGDPRVTSVGRTLRRFSIDELPQLWNVIRGDMALVGPRPPLPEEVAQYDLWAWRRLDQLPGITGVWQVSGRSEIPFPEQVRMDLAHRLDPSKAKDLRVLIRTLPAVISGRGAC